MRENGRIISVAVIVAVAVNSQGRREVLGMAVGASEAETFWTQFPRGLARRGLRGQCLDRRIADHDKPGAEIAAWEQQRDNSGARIKWMFTTDNASTKMARAYPQTNRTITPQTKES